MSAGISNSEPGTLLEFVVDVSADEFRDLAALAFEALGHDSKFALGAFGLRRRCAHLAAASAAR